jgi:hypothetical protein
MVNAAKLFSSWCDKNGVVFSDSDDIEEIQNFRLR